MKKNYKNIDTLQKQVDLQLTLDNFISKRIKHKKYGWIDFNLKESPNFTEFLKSIGFKKFDIESVNYKLQTYKFNKWFLSSIIYDLKSKSWRYIAGQDYKFEIKEIRQYLRNL